MKTSIWHTLILIHYFFIGLHLLFQKTNLFLFYREKGRDLTQSYDKSPFTNRNVKGQGDNTNNATKKFDYRAVADRLRTVSWSNTATQLVWLTWFTGPTFSFPQQPCNQKDARLKICK